MSITLENCVYSDLVNLKSLTPKLVKADYHGAIITGIFNSLEYFRISNITFIILNEFSVSKSKCPGYVGLTGILLQETKNVFKIITKQNEIKSTD
jgi:ribonuclease P protein subunit POP4